MRFVSTAALNILLLSFATGNAQSPPTENIKDCIDSADFDPTVDYFPEKYVPHETTDLFTISYHLSYKIVNNLHNDKSYVLYQCGAPVPADISEDDHHLFLPVPHKGGVAVTQTVQIPMMEVLGLRSDIITYIGNPGLVSSPCLNHNMESGATTIVHNPDDPYNNAWQVNATADWLLSNQEALVFLGPTNPSTGPREVAFAASQERTAVASFDWIGMYAALFNLEGMANRIAEETEDRYDCSAENAAALSANIADEDRVSVLWARHFSSVPGWSVAYCPTWDTAYYCEYAHHCGANLLSRPEGKGFTRQYGGPTVYWYLNDTDFMEFAKDAKHWIYSGSDWDRVYAEKGEMLDQFTAVKNKRVFDTTGQGSNAWFEQRLVEYDVTALDFCDVVGTAVRDDFYVNRWFRNLETGTVGELPACKVPDELDQPYVPPISKCVSPQTDGAPDTLKEKEENGLYSNVGEDVVEVEAKEEEKTGDVTEDLSENKTEGDDPTEDAVETKGTDEGEKKVESSSSPLSIVAVTRAGIAMTAGLVMF